MHITLTEVMEQANSYLYASKWYLDNRVGPSIDADENIHIADALIGLFAYETNAVALNWPTDLTDEEKQAMMSTMKLRDEIAARIAERG